MSGRVVWIGLLCVLFMFKVNGQNLTDSLDHALRRMWEHGQVVGFSVSIFSEDSVYFMKAYGYADRHEKIPYRPETVQKIASVSKLFLGVALMKARAMGLIDFSDDVNKYLPFPLVNPRIKHSKITVLHLATHTSGMRKSVFDYKALYFPTKLKFKFRLKSGLHNFVYLFLVPVLNLNKYVNLRQFLYDIYSPNGKWYYPKLNFTRYEPGQHWIYNNDDASFLALAISKVSNMSYVEFVRKYIFEPLNLKNTRFDFEPLDTNQTQKSCLYHFGIEVPNDYLLVLYPAGGIETNIIDLTKFMQAMIGGYRHGNEILTKQDYQFMLKPQIKKHFHQGILWRFRDKTWVGHRGDIAGATTFAYFDKRTGMGYILLSNSAGTKAIESEHQQIISLLRTYCVKFYGASKLDSMKLSAKNFSPNQVMEASHAKRRFFIARFLAKLRKIFKWLL